MGLNTEKLRDEVVEIRQLLRDGKISNAVARSLILAAKTELESLKAEMEASRLGAMFGPVEYHSADRNGRRLKSVA